MYQVGGGVLVSTGTDRKGRLAKLADKWGLDLPHSLQTRLALGYFCIIAALLVLMNTYPMIMNQNLLFRL